MGIPVTRWRLFVVLRSLDGSLSKTDAPVTRSHMQDLFFRRAAVGGSLYFQHQMDYLAKHDADMRLDMATRKGTQRTDMPHILDDVSRRRLYDHLSKAAELEEDSS